MENKMLEELKRKLLSIKNKINYKKNKIELKNNEIKENKEEIKRVEETRKGDDSRFEAFNEMVDEDIKNRNNEIIKKEKEVEKEKENIKKLEEERKTVVQNAKSEVKKDSNKKLVQINKLNNKVKGLKETARKVKEAKLATTDKTVYKVNDAEHKLKIEEIKQVFKEKNKLYKEYQENQKVLSEIEKIENGILEKSETIKKETTIEEEKPNVVEPQTKKSETTIEKEEKLNVIESQPEERGESEVTIEKDEEPALGEELEINKEDDSSLDGIPESLRPYVQNIRREEELRQAGEDVPQQSRDDEPQQGGEEEPQQAREDEEQQNDNKELYYVGLINQLAEKEGIGPRDMFKKIVEEGKNKKIKPIILVESYAQEEGIIPLDIKEISIDETNYTIKFGPLGVERTYKIGEENEKDNLKIDLSRKSEAQFKETIMDEFPSSEDCINKLDVGLMQIYINAGRRDLCQKYIDSINKGEKLGDLPKTEYALYQAKGLSRNETVVRRNARNNESIADVKGLTESRFTRAFDWVRNAGANMMVKLEKLTLRDKWKEEVGLLQDGMKLMLGDGKQETINKGFRDSEYIKDGTPSLEEQAELAATRTEKQNSEKSVPRIVQENADVVIIEDSNSERD